MLSRSILTVFALVLLCVYAVESKPNDRIKCKEHEEYTKCGALCQRTCNSPYKIFCPLYCVEGCVCKPGYIRDENYECIPPRKCPPRVY